MDDTDGLRSIHVPTAVTHQCCVKLHDIAELSHITSYPLSKPGFKVTQAHTGAMTLIQRFGSALNLNLHFHVLFIDGIFSRRGNGQLRFHWFNAPACKELNELVATISERVARYLECRGRPARAMAARWRLIKCQVCDGVGCCCKLSLQLSLEHGCA